MNGMMIKSILEESGGGAPPAIRQTVTSRIGRRLRRLLSSGSSSWAVRFGLWNVDGVGDPSSHRSSWDSPSARFRRRTWSRQRPVRGRRVPAGPRRGR